LPDWLWPTYLWPELDPIIFWRVMVHPDFLAFLISSKYNLMIGLISGGCQWVSFGSLGQLNGK
jgi:hypothetical protein